MPLTRYFSGKAVAEKNHEGIHFKAIMSTKVSVFICLLVCSIITLTIEGKILITVNKAPDFNLQRRRSVGTSLYTDDPAPLKKQQQQKKNCSEERGYARSGMNENEAVECVECNRRDTAQIVGE